MNMYMTGVARPVYMSLSGDREYAVIAMAWDEEENVTRYLLAADERPTWVSEFDIVRTTVREEVGVG